MESGPAPASDPRWVAILLGKAGLWGSLAWGFAEGTLFFIVPDVLFTLTTLLRPRRGLLQLGAAVLGAVAGGGLMCAWAVRAPRDARSAVSAVPFVGERMVAATERRWNEEGARALFDRPLNGVPFKVYAVLAPGRMSGAGFLLASVLMRSERMAISWIVFASAGLLLASLGVRRRIVLIGLHAGFWTALYACYWS